MQRNFQSVPACCTVTNGGVSGNVGLILIQARATAFSSCAQYQLPRTEHLSMKGRLELITPGTPTHVFQDRLGLY